MIHMVAYKKSFLIKKNRVTTVVSYSDDVSRHSFFVIVYLLTCKIV